MDFSDFMYGASNNMRDLKRLSVSCDIFNFDLNPFTKLMIADEFTRQYTRLLRDNLR